MITGRLMAAAAAVALVAGCMQRVDVTPVTLNANGGTAAGVARPAGMPMPEHLSVARTVPADLDRKLGFFVSLHEDCTVVPGLDIRILTSPTHGTARLQGEKDYPSFPAGNPRASCNKATAPGQQLWYQPAPGFIGTDVVLLQIYWPTGPAQTLTYTITVQGGGVPPTPATK
ncbi:hypothetical protein FHS74_001892 [Nitrospirillum iridis]|uniref:Lipoprotein n=2 Tax=Nitrospirillum iridis TaxID=765888 RepID=A0A7X0AWD7_9PROT|nr:hypothetical protein [Nitrospirillum iridis]